MRFKRPQVRYADTPQPATPYQSAAFGLLVIGKVPPVLVVALASGAGWLLTP